MGKLNLDNGNIHHPHNQILKQAEPEYHLTDPTINSFKTNNRSLIKFSRYKFLKSNSYLKNLHKLGYILNGLGRKKKGMRIKGGVKTFMLI